MEENMDIKVLKRADKQYPCSLRLIKDPPEELYCIGDLRLLSKRAVAVVGSRKCSEYGRQTAMKIGAAAAANDVVTVSGMAKGIDSFAHLGALKNGGKTIAVLGSGPDVCYPRENYHIYEKIIKEGLIISELPPGIKPKPYTFPRRNRIISGISEAVTVVEAGTDSGALITAELAASQGKEVFAVPGNISSIYSLGTNKLITDGARAVAVVDDIFYGMGVPVRLQEAELEKLGKDERDVYNIVRDYGETTVDYVCAILQKNPFEINGILSVLEMKGFVCYNLGKIFIAKY